MLVALGITLAFFASWLGDILSTFQHLPALPGQYRVLRFFGIANIGWALAVVVATSILAFGRKVFGADDPKAAASVGLVAMLAAAAGAVVAVSAIVDLITVLTLGGQKLANGDGVTYIVRVLGLPGGINGAISAAVEYLAVAIIGAVSAIWALRTAGDKG